MKEWLTAAEKTVGAPMWASLRPKYDTNGWALVSTIETTRKMANGDYYFMGIAEDASVALSS